MRHRGQQLPYDPGRKIRTPEHVLADLSYNFLERKVLQRGHWLDAPRNDYGIDATMFYHDANGRVENGEVRFQLKATSQLKATREGVWIAQRVDARDLRYWYFELFPVIIVLYERAKTRAFWLHLQEYLDRHPAMIDSDASTITLRIPTSNKLTLHAIDFFRRQSLDCMAKWRKGLRSRT